MTKDELYDYVKSSPYMFIGVPIAILLRRYDKQLKEFNWKWTVKLITMHTLDKFQNEFSQYEIPVAYYKYDFPNEDRFNDIIAGFEVDETSLSNDNMCYYTSIYGKIDPLIKAIADSENYTTQAAEDFGTWFMRKKLKDCNLLTDTIAREMLNNVKIEAVDTFARVIVYSTTITKPSGITFSMDSVATPRDYNEFKLMNSR